MKQASFFSSVKKSKWGSSEEVERRRRILVSAAAYAYEILNDPFWPDSKYDREARKINLRQKTGNMRMDTWFKNNFKPNTGMWVRNHPNKNGLKRIALKLIRWNRPDRRIQRKRK